MIKGGKLNTERRREDAEDTEGAVIVRLWVLFAVAFFDWGKRLISRKKEQKTQRIRKKLAVIVKNL